MAGSGVIRIGVSGWSYPSWRGSFYPSDLPQKDELAYAARRFSAIEINATFYRLQNPDSFGRWRDATPDDFVFAVKGPGFITHRVRLREVDVTSDVVYCRLHGIPSSSTRAATTARRSIDGRSAFAPGPAAASQRTPSASSARPNLACGAVTFSSSSTTTRWRERRSTRRP